MSERIRDNSVEYDDDGYGPLDDDGPAVGVQTNRPFYLAYDEEPETWEDPYESGPADSGSVDRHGVVQHVIGFIGDVLRDFKEGTF